MATFDVAKLLNKITQDIPGINTVLKALAKWDVSALTDVPDGAMQATTDTNNRLTIKKKVSGSYSPVAKLMHDVDRLDGYHASASATANAVAVRNAQGALPGNITGNAATADTAVALAAGSVIPLNQGGTGATTASQARTNLGVAGSADFSAHIAKQASPSVEGHVKLDALAADGSNTAAPGGFGLGMPEATQLTANTDLDSVVLPGFYSCKQNAVAATLLNCPVKIAFSMLVEFGAYGPTQTITGYTDGIRFQRIKPYSTTFGEWRILPNGISNSTSTTSSTIAASATAVKAAYDRAKQVATASISGGVKVGGAIDSVSADGTVTLRQASISQRGDVQLSSSVTSSSAVTAANSLAVKTAYDKAVESAGFTGDIFASLATSRAGCLLMNGAAVSRTTYADLFSIIGTTFGAGNGSTTFNLPDARGRTMQGASGNLMALLAAGLPNITGRVNIGALAGGSSGALYDVTTGAIQRRTTDTSSNSSSVNIDASRSSSIYGNSTTVQSPAIAVNYFIKY